MRLRNLVLAVLIGAVPAIVIVACGGDDDAPIVAVPTTTAPADQLSKDAFIDEADQICEEANAAIASLAETSAGDPSSAIAQERELSLIHISEPTRLRRISYAVFCLKK